MAKSKAEKGEIVRQLEEMVADSKGVLVIAPKSVNPNEAADLKKRLAEVGGEYHVVKNSLFKLALTNSGITGVDAAEIGHNAVVFVGEQSPEAAKILKEFIKETEKAEFKQGILDGKVLSKEQLEALADLPSREQLLAQVVGTINAPISGFVNVLAGNIRGIVTVIDAIKQAKDSGKLA